MSRTILVIVNVMYLLLEFLFMYLILLCTRKRRVETFWDFTIYIERNHLISSIKCSSKEKGR